VLNGSVSMDGCAALNEQNRQRQTYIRGKEALRMLIFPPRHMHMRLVSALSAARGVCVLLFCQKTEELHTPAHPCKC